MARYTGPRARICRRLDFPVFESPKFSSIRKNYPPGQHGDSRRSKLSNYGLQLQEKQKIKFMYGLLEKQFRLNFERAEKMKGETGTNMLQLLESRLDNVVYRLGFAPSRPAARQLVSHKHFLVNKSIVNIPSYLLKPGDEIEVRQKSRKMDIVIESMRRIKGDMDLSWLGLDKAKMKGTFQMVPDRDEMKLTVNEQLVVELYSK